METLTPEERDVQALVTSTAHLASAFELSDGKAEAFDRLMAKHPARNTYLYGVAAAAAIIIAVFLVWQGKQATTLDKRQFAEAPVAAIHSSRMDSSKVESSTTEEGGQAMDVPRPMGKKSGKPRKAKSHVHHTKTTTVEQRVNELMAAANFQGGQVEAYYFLNGKPTPQAEVNKLKPDDIKNVTVLKRGSAAAIEANKDGNTCDIILVTTK